MKSFGARCTQQALRPRPPCPCSLSPHTVAAGTLHPFRGVGTVKGVAQRGTEGARPPEWYAS